MWHNQTDTNMLQLSGRSSYRQRYSTLLTSHGFQGDNSLLEAYLGPERDRQVYSPLRFIILQGWTGSHGGNSQRDNWTEEEAIMSYRRLRHSTSRRSYSGYLLRRLRGDYCLQDGLPYSSWTHLLRQSRLIHKRWSGFLAGSNRPGGCLGPTSAHSVCSLLQSTILGVWVGCREIGTSADPSHRTSTFSATRLYLLSSLCSILKRWTGFREDNSQHEDYSQDTLSLSFLILSRWYSIRRLWSGFLMATRFRDAHYLPDILRYMFLIRSRYPRYPLLTLLYRG